MNKEDKENKKEEIKSNNLTHLSYQQKYYINNKERIKRYQKTYYQTKKGSKKDYVFEIQVGKFILNMN